MSSRDRRPFVPGSEQKQVISDETTAKIPTGRGETKVAGREPEEVSKSFSRKFREGIRTIKHLKYNINHAVSEIKYHIPDKLLKHFPEDMRERIELEKTYRSIPDEDKPESPWDVLAHWGNDKLYEFEVWPDLKEKTVKILVRASDYSGQDSEGKLVVISEADKKEIIKELPNIYTQLLLRSSMLLGNGIGHLDLKTDFPKEIYENFSSWLQKEGEKYQKKTIKVLEKHYKAEKELLEEYRPLLNKARSVKEAGKLKKEAYKKLQSLEKKKGKNLAFDNNVGKKLKLAGRTGLMIGGMVAAGYIFKQIYESVSESAIGTFKSTAATLPDSSAVSAFYTNLANNSLINGISKDLENLGNYLETVAGGISGKSDFVKGALNGLGVLFNGSADVLEGLNTGFFNLLSNGTIKLNEALGWLGDLDTHISNMEAGLSNINSAAMSIADDYLGDAGQILVNARSYIDNSILKLKLFGTKIAIDNSGNLYTLLPDNTGDDVPDVYFSDTSNAPPGSTVHALNPAQQSLFGYNYIIQTTDSGPAAEALGEFLAGNTYEDWVNSAMGYLYSGTNLHQLQVVDGLLETAQGSITQASVVASNIQDLVTNPATGLNKEAADMTGKVQSIRENIQNLKSSIAAVQANEPAYNQEVANIRTNASKLTSTSSPDDIQNYLTGIKTDAGKVNHVATSTSAEKISGSEAYTLSKSSKDAADAGTLIKNSLVSPDSAWGTYQAGLVNYSDNVNGIIKGGIRAGLMGAALPFAVQVPILGTALVVYSAGNIGKLAVNTVKGLKAKEVNPGWLAQNFSLSEYK